MQCCKKDNTFIINELKIVFKKHPDNCSMHVFNDLLESLGHRLDSNLMDQVMQLLPSLGLRRNEKTYEVLLAAQLSAHNFEAVQSLAVEMKDSEVLFTARALVTIIKAALRTSNFADALQSFRELKAHWAAGDCCSNSPSQAPRHIVSQLVELACKERQLCQFLPELKGVPITE